MKHTTHDHRVPLIPRPRIRSMVANKSSALIKPKPSSKKAKTEMETIARWEDDGGQLVLEADAPVEPSNPDTAKGPTDK